MKRLLAVVIALAPPAPALAAGELWLPSLFGDHMVLQRERPLPVWGKAAPGQEVEVRLAGQEHATVAGGDGSWRVTLAPLPAGGPWELVVEAGEEERRCSDVRVGEVWLASGQSNMQWRLDGALDPEIEIRRAEDPELRFFTVERRSSARPREDVEAGGWQLSSPGTAPGFSAVAYFFARRLRRELGVPVGVIHSSWGGTVAEAWTSAPALEALGGFERELETLRESAGRDAAVLGAEHAAAVAAREASIAERDAGTSAGEPVWAAPDLDDTAWRVMELPGPFDNQELPGFDGVVWFRREVTLPAAWAERELTLELGPIDDADVTWLDGVELGSSDSYDAPRVYRVPRGVAPRAATSWRCGCTTGAATVASPARPPRCGSARRARRHGAWPGSGATASGWISTTWRRCHRTPRAPIGPRCSTTPCWSRWRPTPCAASSGTRASRTRIGHTSTARCSRP